MVNAAQRFRSAPGPAARTQFPAPGPEAGLAMVSSSAFSTSTEIAGMSQATIRFQSVADTVERGVDASRRAAAGKFVPIDRIREPAVSDRITHQGHASGRLLHRSRQVFGQCGSPVGQQGFIPAHPGTPAPGQHESGPLHERIIALAARPAPGFAAACGLENSGYNRIKQEDAFLFGTYSGTVVLARVARRPFYPANRDSPARPRSRRGFGGAGGCPHRPPGAKRCCEIQTGATARRIAIPGRSQDLGGRNREKS